MRDTLIRRLDGAAGLLAAGEPFDSEALVALLTDASEALIDDASALEQVDEAVTAAQSVYPESTSFGQRFAYIAGRLDGRTSAAAPDKPLHDALRLASDRLDRLTLELPHGSRIRASAVEWTEEARKALKA